jgi:hypothetical protein
MKRINIRYNGATYSVSNRDYDGLQQEVVAALTSGKPNWLEVNEGEGTPRPALLLITPGVSLTLVPIPEPHPDADTTTNNDERPESAR